MARIPYPDPATQSGELRDKLARLGSLNVTRMMSHSDGALNGYSRLGTFLLRKGKLDPVVREAVILRIGQLCGSDYEWHQHASVALAVGMDEAMLRSIAEQDYAALPEPHRVAISIAEEVKAAGAVRPETMATASGMFSHEELVELVLCAGFYIMTAAFLASFAIEIETSPPLGAAMAASGS